MQQQARKKGQIVSYKTSRTVRETMRMVTMYGSGRKAEAEGYELIAKTGTAYQNKGRGYGGKERTTSCVGAFPLSDPQIMIVVMLDDPKPSKETYNYATAGWNAAPTLGEIVSRIAPILDIHPVSEPTEMKYAHWYEEGPKVIQTKHQVSE
jgi:cell division protein FtsI (penicillin-binding protein 3)